MNNNSTNNADTRLFLARVVAWPQDGDTPAYVNVHNTFAPTDMSKLKVVKGKTLYPWGGRACRSVDEAINYIKWQYDGSGRDIYFCTSTQSMAQRKDGKGGRVYYNAMRSQEQAVKLKAIFIDIDLKDGDHGYSTMQELTAALGAFLKATGLPRPTMMVMSGGGVHVYWLLHTPLGVNEWLPLAYALNEAIRRHGLKCDSQCTIDSARVLRVPGTSNFKFDPPKPVTLHGNYLDFDYLNTKIEKALEPYKVKVPYSISSPFMSILPPKPPLAGTSDLSAGIDISGAQPVDLNSLVAECGFITEALATGGRSFTNPLWNLTTLISTFTTGSRADAHRMASGHDDYSIQETDELFDRKVEEKLLRDIGWPTCAAIKSSGCSHCAVCVHLSENKSPLNHSLKAPNTPASNTIVNQSINSSQNSQVTLAGNIQQAGLQNPPAGQTAGVAAGSSIIPGTGVQDPDLPNGYNRNSDGLILTSYQAEAGVTIWTPVSEYPMKDPWLQRNPWILNFTTKTEHGKDTTVSVSMKDVNTSEMRKELQDQAFLVTGGARGFSNLSDFIMAWIQKLQKEKDSIISSVPFGWAVKDGKVGGFVFSGRMYTPKGEETALNTDPELARQFTPVGERQYWIDCAKIITDQKRPALDAILASSFAAPLVRFTGHSGLLLSAYSVESGIGKSTALKIAQAVWGDPVKAVQSLSDTQNSVLNKMGELKSLPLYWDELQSEDDSKKFVDTVFRLSLGKERSRLTSKVTQRTPGTWQTIMVAASNDSLMDAVANRNKTTMAGVYRIFEYIVTPAGKGAIGQIDPTVAQRKLAKLNDNHGMIGVEYAKFLGTNLETIEKHMASTLKGVGDVTKMHPDERFWVSMIACLIMGASYSNHLGFTDIDVPQLKAFLTGTLAKMRKTRSAHTSDIQNVVNVVSILGRFLNEKRARNTMITNIIYRQRGKPPQGMVHTAGVDMTKMDTIMVHVGKDDKTLRIGRSYLMEWLIENHHPRQVFFEAMEATLGAKYVNARLAAGTPLAGASEHLLEIDLTATPLIDFINES